MAFEQETAGGFRTGTGVVVSGPCSLDCVGALFVTAGTAIFRDGGATGPIVWVLGAGANTSASHTFQSKRRIKSSLYVVCSQTDAIVGADILMPTSAQLDPA